MLTSILKEGAQFSSLAETALADRLSQMLDLVTAETADGDVPLVMALIDSVPPENIVSMAPLPMCEYLLGIIIRVVLMILRSLHFRMSLLRFL